MIKFLLRRGDEPDRPAIAALLASQSMEADLAPDECILAEVGGRLVGLARLEQAGDAAYIRPVVVDAGWQGKGLGRRLVREISKGLPEVHVISRGEAAGFYSCLGFVPAPWAQVPESYRQECEACPDREECRPVPMSLNRTGKGLKQIGFNRQRRRSADQS